MEFVEFAPLLATVADAEEALSPVQMLRDYNDLSPLVVLSNRIPYVFDGGRIVRSVSGLVSSVEAGLQGISSSVWLGWNGSFDNSDTLTCRAPGSPTTIVGIPLKREYLQSYYSRVCNSYLFPAYCGTREGQTDISGPEWDAYRLVNQIFADEACRVAARRATVWINDFHLQLCPQLIKHERPDLHVVYFQHVPFPSAESFCQIPWWKEILRGISGADRIGVQTPRDRKNLLEYQTRFLSRDDQSAATSQPKPREPVENPPIIVAPAEIDTQRWQGLGRDREIAAKARRLRSLIGNPQHVFVGVDRLEPTKGIPEKVRAFIELSNEGIGSPGPMAFLQVAVTSDPCSLHGSDTLLSNMKDELSRAVVPSPEASNVYLTTSPLSWAELAIIYSIADTLVVTSLSDGMNLVVKEFIAFKGWHPYKLVVSRSAGVAEDLPTDILVNPRDSHDVVVVMRRCVSNLRVNPDESVTRTPQFVNRNAVEWAYELLFG
jgi:trehalose 6-phosphate synthase